MHSLQVAPQTKLGVLEAYYGYDSFRPGQEAIIDAILSGRDAMAIMPTSAGKSLCFQVPALLLPGVTLVISPLISLMQDQVSSLEAMGIPAVLINSGQSLEENRQAIVALRSGQVKLAYIAPERLSNDYFLNLVSQLEVSLVAVDEAHCISQWGNDFRPSYQAIPHLLDYLAKRPVMAAFTATATHQVRQDIVHYLKLEDPFEMVTGFDRPNLFFALEEPSDKMRRLKELLASGEPSIVYCATRKDVESVAGKLNQAGIQARPYHAGMDMLDRHATQRAFQFDEIQVVVATNAFGMGIDKSNVRQVIHYAMPKDLESYYQEAGRAGRDGEDSRCTLFYSDRDIMTNVYLIEQGGDPIGRQKLNEMIDYCRTTQCLRGVMLRYFGEIPHESNCQSCTNCTTTVEQVDITVPAQKILACVYRMGQRYGLTKVAEVLKGSQKADIKGTYLADLPTYGLMKDLPEAQIKRYISALVVEGYLKMVGQDYPILNLTSKAKPVLKGQEQVSIKHTLAMSIAKMSQVKARGNESHDAYDQVLFERLRQVRYDLAQKHQVPPFIIFSDATLRALCRHFPTTETAFLTISGVGQKKLSQYGFDFMQAIEAYLAEKDQ